MRMSMLMCGMISEDRDGVGAVGDCTVVSRPETKLGFF